MESPPALSRAVQTCPLPLLADVALLMESRLRNVREVDWGHVLEVEYFRLWDPACTGHVDPFVVDRRLEGAATPRAKRTGHRLDSVLP